MILLNYVLNLQLLSKLQLEIFYYNASIFDHVTEMTPRWGWTPSQHAFDWKNHQGNDVGLLSSTTTIENLNQNIEAFSIMLMPEEMVEVESFASTDAPTEKVKENWLIWGS